MWENNKSTSNTIILSMNYYDFSSIIVEKRITSKGNIYYELKVSVDDVIEQIVDISNIDNVKTVISNIKPMIEDLYEDIIDMDDNELNLWVEDFLDQINDY